MKSYIFPVVLVVCILISSCGRNDSPNSEDLANMIERRADDKRKVEAEKAARETDEQAIKVEKRSIEDELKGDINEILEKYNLIQANERKNKICKMIIYFLALIVIVWGGWLFWPRKTVERSTSVDLYSSTKCPRCGWEHAPDAKICRNPNCKTQF